jgi:hypothetical protein
MILMKRNPEIELQGILLFKNITNTIWVKRRLFYAQMSGYRKYAFTIGDNMLSG